MSNLVMPTEDRDAYVKAQKQRNLFIALGLLVFVGLVFAVSVVRISEGIANDRAARQAATSGLSNVPPAEAPAAPKP